MAAIRPPPRVVQTTGSGSQQREVEWEVGRELGKVRRAALRHAHCSAGPAMHAAVLCCCAATCARGVLSRSRESVPHTFTHAFLSFVRFIF